jgi:hypothetical protein
MALYSGGVMVASTSQACTSCSMILLTRASILKAGRQLVARHVADGGAQLVQHQLHPQLAGLVLHDEQHLVVRGRQRLLRAEDGVQLQVVAVAHVGAEVELGALVVHDGFGQVGSAGAGRVLGKGHMANGQAHQVTACAG